MRINEQAGGVRPALLVPIPDEEQPSRLRHLRFWEVILVASLLKNEMNRIQNHRNHFPDPLRAVR